MSKTNIYRASLENSQVELVLVANTYIPFGLELPTMFWTLPRLGERVQATDSTRVEDFMMFRVVDVVHERASLFVHLQYDGA